jgi:hypothetical protein
MADTRLPHPALLLLVVLSILANNTIASDPDAVPSILSFAPDGSVTASWKGETNRLAIGQRLGQWTLMGMLRREAENRLAVFEDFSEPKGRIVFVGPGGFELPKSLEPTSAEPASLYRGHTLAEVFNSERDLLGEELLSQGGDPRYADVAACFPPISKMYVYSFVGTHECLEKVGVFYGGATPNFDPIAYVPALEKIRAEARVQDGLVGGWLPVLRFVYPEKEGTWSELLMFAPSRVENGNTHVQPVWYRVCRVEDNALRWVRYFDSYHPFPPRMEASAERFYQELAQLRTGLSQALSPGMQIDIPDRRLSDMARHSLVREMMTRVGDFPKYGVFDRGYGGSEHDGFQDTFNVDTTAMLEWGLFDLARQYIDNYFTYFVRDDGSILYRGPETGQFGRMLTVIAKYVNCTGDHELLLRHRQRIDAVTDLLLGLRAKALELPAGDPAHGMIAGWSEADACIDPDPPRYMRPYFSNSTEAARGFEDLGVVWERVARKQNRLEFAARGKKLREESRALAQDVQTAISRSMLTNTEPPCLPSIAGATEPFHVAVAKDKLDPQFRSYRAYMEMLYSGNLTREQVETIVRYRSAHHDIILGLPTAYGHNTHEVAGFLTYGHAYGLLQHDFIREYLLTLYSMMAHQYTRGLWIAPETRKLEPKQYAAPYCTPAQMVVPLMTRWMLVFEEPASDRLWLAKGTPRDWLDDGQTVAVTNAPTRWGPVSFALRSHIRTGKIEAKLNPPAQGANAEMVLRLRVPEGHRIRSVTVNGKDWTQFDAKAETVTLPKGTSSVDMTVNY